MNTHFNEHDLILFTGDGITDCDRDRSNPNSLGMGYVGMIAGRLALAYPELNLRFRNTGISGNCMRDLLARWDEDCVRLEPNWASILVGVNNIWRFYPHSEPPSDQEFESEYRELLQRVKDSTTAKLVLCSPFLVHTDLAVTSMRSDMDAKIDIIKKLSDELGAIWVDFDAAFVAAQQRHIPTYWAPDGVHPSIAGHALMAETWIGIVSG